MRIRMGLLICSIFSFVFIPQSGLATLTRVSVPPPIVRVPLQGKNNQTVQTLREQHIIRHRLRKLGLSEEDIDHRLSLISEKETHLLVLYVRTHRPLKNGL